MQRLARRLGAWPAYRWVCLMLAGYFVVALLGTWVNYLELHLAGGIGFYDLSLNQQALSSTFHSNQPFPFYEATNCGKNDRCSFLLVHPVFLAYAVAVPYGVWPSAFTLFAIQDLALALAALPLFGIARIVTQSSRLSVAVAGVYLVWLPSFTGIFSFHWEAFIPLEFFLIFWLWLTHRYRWAIPVVIAAYVTLEVVPVLLFFMAIFFLIPWFGPAQRLLRTEVRRLILGRDPILPPLRSAMARVRAALLAERRLLASIYLLLGSIAAYVLIHEFVAAGGFLLGLPPLPAQYVLPITRPVYAAVFTFQNLASGWRSKLIFWLVIYGTLALVPFLAPRTLVLAAPWIVYSLFTSSSFYRMGDQYGFVSSAVILIGFAYGVAQLKQWADPTPTGQGNDPAGSAKTDPTAEPKVRPASAPSSTSHTPGPDAAPDRPTDARPTVERAVTWRRRRRARVLLGAILAGVLVFNLFLNPLNPLSVPLKMDRPFASQSALALRGGLDTTDYDHVQTLVSMVGSRSIVAVSPMLFTFVANDPRAYPLLAGMDLSFLPFNAVEDTQFVLLLDHSGTTLPKFLGQEIYNSSIFGVRAWIPTTYLGGVLLFERGYTGPTESLGIVPVYGGGVYTGGAGLTAGSAGTLAANNSSLSGVVVSSAPQAGQSVLQRGGEVFAGPGVTLVGGSYSVEVLLNGTVSSATLRGISPASTTVVTLLLSGFGNVIDRTLLSVSALTRPGWSAFTFNFTLPYPVLDFQVSGFNHRDWYGFSVNYVSITPISTP